MKCPKCYGEMRQGIALEEIYTCSHPKSDNKYQTMYPSGKSKLIECMKCKSCGYSITGKYSDNDPVYDPVGIATMILEGFICALCEEPLQSQTGVPTACKACQRRIANAIRHGELKKE